MEKIKLMIAENDEDENLFMVEGFSSTGLFEVVGNALSAEELLDQLNQENHPIPDLIITDQNMPGKTGFDLIVTLKASPKYASVPIIVLSTASTRAMVDKCMEIGGYAYLVKPDTFTEYDRLAHSLYQQLLNGEAGGNGMKWS
jgi:CheY-like chemotaxis protein